LSLHTFTATGTANARTEGYNGRENQVNTPDAGSQNSTIPPAAYDSTAPAPSGIFVSSLVNA
jgi:hypothetical protein